MNTRKPIEVCITVDTEFSIGGNFEDPALTTLVAFARMTRTPRRGGLKGTDLVARSFLFGTLANGQNPHRAGILPCV
jgi:hypothetical protein